MLILVMPTDTSHRWDQHSLILPLLQEDTSVQTAL